MEKHNKTLIATEFFEECKKLRIMDLIVFVFIVIMELIRRFFIGLLRLFVSLMNMIDKLVKKNQKNKDNKRAK